MMFIITETRTETKQKIKQETYTQTIWNQVYI